MLAAGRCTVNWNRHEYAAGQAQVVEDVAASAELSVAFGPVPAVSLAAMGTHQLLRSRVPDAARIRARASQF